MKNSQLIAHRGWQRRYPENTLIAIREAIATGCKHIEIDIQLSADHIPFVCHDHLLQRLCLSPLNLNQIHSSELDTLSAYEPERLGDQFLGTPLLTLSDCVKYIAQYPDVTLYAEIKRQSIRSFGHQVVMDAIKPLLTTIEQQCFVISFDLPILTLFKQQQWSQTALVLSDWEQAFSQQVNQLAPTMLFCDVDFLTAAKTPAQLPYPTAIYEIDNYQQAQQLIAAGAAMIETFAIGELIAAGG
ncbi:glycerophosphodiester phosphodiesterase family protein [Oceanicoccus sp. KOV_DT_Chl]|uniref:glycerophosphodiester phosphodiesterase family protein n=1 Tax=Oceanicoccus sp. KOV_DT_Chl TaxID=1904639 RepID=UPI000C7A6152|nr:glycerophosphodiester phosphodiesterase family protein [Oceanicoccus sp. KOV_DT_Chl]